MRSLRAAPEGDLLTDLTGLARAMPTAGLSPRGDVCLASRWFGCDSRLVHRRRARSSSSSTCSLVLFSVHGSTWLEHSVRVGGIGGSNPPAQTERVPSGTGSSCRRGPIW